MPLREEHDIFAAIAGLIDRRTKGRVKMANVTTKHSDNEALLAAIQGGSGEAHRIQDDDGVRFFMCGISVCAGPDVCSP